MSVFQSVEPLQSNQSAEPLESVSQSAEPLESVSQSAEPMQSESQPTVNPLPKLRPMFKLWNLIGQLTHLLLHIPQLDGGADPEPEVERLLYPKNYEAFMNDVEERFLHLKTHQKNGIINFAI